MPPTIPLPTTADSVPDRSITSDKLTDHLVSVSIGSEMVTDQPAHAIEDIVQNTTDKPIVVVVGLTMHLPAQNDAVQAQLLVEDVTPPTVIIDFADSLNANLAGIDTACKLVGIVKPGQFYQVHKAGVVGTGDLVFQVWTEYTL